MKGYKGFEKGLICLGKQYAENTVFEEDSADICKKGMHFCENPFDVLCYYGFVGDNAELNEFAEVESLDECVTDDNTKFSTTKLKIGKKIGIDGLCKAFVDFTLSKIYLDDKSATNTGDRSAALNAGDNSAATVEGNESFAISTGFSGKAKGKIGCYLAVAEWFKENGIYKLKDFKSVKVDGETIKEDTFYSLVDGKFVEVNDDD